MPSSDTPSTRPAGLLAWLAPAAGFLLLISAVWSHDRNGEVQAGGGSPYYDSAVKQALDGLRGGGAGAEVPAGRPPLAAGLDPAEYEWCEQCKTYHKREGAAPAGTPEPPPLLRRAAEDDAGRLRPIPPLPAGLNPDDYVWDEPGGGYKLRKND